jgi:hypothetical protein
MERKNLRTYWLVWVAVIDVKKKVLINSMLLF